MSEKLTDKYNATVSGYVPAAPGWYLREQNNAGKNVYHPVMAWRECFGVGPLKEGVLIPVLPSGLTGRTVTEISGDVMYMFDSFLSPNGDGTFTDNIAEQLEKRGLWRRAARRWLDVMDSTTDEKLREAAALRRNHCQRMATGAKPDTRLMEM